jgi:hypothetical protein
LTCEKLRMFVVYLCCLLLLPSIMNMKVDIVYRNKHIYESLARSFPRRDPKELNSWGSIPWLWSHFAAGDPRAILRAGEMWSVVIESPKRHKTRAWMNTKVRVATIQGTWIYDTSSTRSNDLLGCQYVGAVNMYM